MKESKTLMKTFLYKDLRTYLHLRDIIKDVKYRKKKSFFLSKPKQKNMIKD